MTFTTSEHRDKNEMDMSRRLLFLLISWTFSSLAAAADRPNFLWILSEDNSKHYLSLYDEGGAATPHIEQLASHGLVFEHAFSCAPVCSVARTTLMTGVYAPRAAAQFHRRIKLTHLPDGWELFPAYLRTAGYYTTNNSKKDYNAVEGEVWDASSKNATWRNRPTLNTPFFHMQSYPASHESSLHFSTAEMDAAKLAAEPTKVPLAPCFPDTELFRYTHAYYLSRMPVIDDLVGELVGQLEQDGLLEDTFIFYFGDHGGVLPRSKGYIYESGLHVPLVVRVPDKWRHLVPFPSGSRVDGFVSFVDFGPTLLKLAGADLPDHFDGRPFLGKGVTAEEVNTRDEAFGYADRFDEKYDLCRSLRKGQYKYIRNYQAFYPDALQNNYRYKMLAYQEWRDLYRQGKLNETQRQFFETKPAEALFDLQGDPYETRNLANDPQYANVLRDLRGRLVERLKSMPDLSFYPESVLVEQAVADPIAFGELNKNKIGKLIDTADLILLPFDEARPKLEAALSSNDPNQRYWALIVCSCFGERAASLSERARELLKDSDLLVRLRSAEFLGIIGAEDPRPTLSEVLRISQSPVISLLTLNTVVFFHDRSPGLRFELPPLAATNDEVNRRLEYLNQE
jgi:uncharacterized sulfatase